MAYREGNRTQITLLPDSVDKYVLEDDPVRVYDAFIDCLDMKELGIKLNPNAVGNSSYDPVTMLKILVYAYSYGWRSSRKIERALHHNLSFIWIAGGLKPDFKTISSFRKNNLKALKNVLVQCARLCLKLNLIQGNTLFIDGSKFRANAGNRETRSLAKWEKYEKHVIKRIDQLLQESKSIDDNDSASLIKVEKELTSQKRLKNKITHLLKEFKDEEKVNGTDPDCRILKGRQGSHAGYNVQATTDEANGLIVSLEGTTSANDMNELASQVKQAEENLEQISQTVCADAGYASVKDIIPLLKQGKKIIVPSSRQSRKENNKNKENPFSKEYFIYDSEQDTYTCPQGKELYRSTKDSNVLHADFRMKNANDCRTCQHYGICTKSKQGRRIRRSKNQETIEYLENIYESEAGQQVYQKRKMKAELQFGHLKRNLGAGAFLLRGVKGVNAELSILGTCFNLARIITLLGGVRPLMSRLSEIR